MKFGAAKAEQKRSGQAVEPAAARAVRARTLSIVDQSELGWRAFFWLAFVVAIAALAGWSSKPTQNGGAQIDDVFGLCVAGGLGVVLVGLAFGPSLLERLRSLGQSLSGLGVVLFWLTRPITAVLFALDWALRNPVAWVCGLTSVKPLVRYPVLFAHLTLAGGVVLATPPEFAWRSLNAMTVQFVALIWAFVVLLAVIRKWLWTEQQFDQSEHGASTDHLPDLRDEALTSLLLFFAAIPVVFQLLHAWSADGQPLRSWTEAQIFVAPDDANYFTWLAFFGAQLLRAVPFVDWAEVYSVGESTQAGLSSPESPRALDVHIMFVTRVLVDLVLLGTIVHTVERSSRLAKQAREFELGGRTRLDPYLQNKWLNRQMRPGGRNVSWEKFEREGELGPFATYDAALLKRVATSPNPDRRGFALHALASPARPGDALVELARDRLKLGSRGGPIEDRPELRLLMFKLLGARAEDTPAAVVALIDVVSGATSNPDDRRSSDAQEALTVLQGLAATAIGRRVLGRESAWGPLQAALGGVRNATALRLLASFIIRVDPDRAATVLVERLESERIAARVTELADALLTAAVTPGLAEPTALITRLDARASDLERPDAGAALRAAVEKVRRAAGAWRERYGVAAS